MKRLERFLLPRENKLFKGGTESNVRKLRIVFISTGQQEPRDGKKYKNEEGRM